MTGYNPDDIAWPRYIEAIRLELTCYACPEQYDAFLDDRQVGYLRLRHGEFRVDCPNVGGETVYRSEPAGDGMFDDDERAVELIKAKAAIATWLLTRTGFYMIRTGRSGRVGPLAS
jgi:hypothetical protein